MFQRKSTSVFCAVVLGCFLAVLLGALLIFASDVLASALMLAAVITIPGAILGWFILSKVLYTRARREESDDLPALKTRLTVATVLLVFLAVIAAALFVLFSLAIMYM